MFIKTFDATGTPTGAERIDDPTFIHWQASNGRMARCAREDAQGIVGADGNTTYLLNGAQPHGELEPYAEIISETEYEEIAAGYDPEDEAPELPEQEQAEMPLTRAELTAIVNEQASQIEFLEDCLIEMSKIVYA